MPGEDARRGNHGRLRETGEKRVVSPNHGRSVYERGIHARADVDVGREHGHKQHRDQRGARRGWKLPYFFNIRKYPQNNPRMTDPVSASEAKQDQSFSRE